MRLRRVAVLIVMGGVSAAGCAMGRRTDVVVSGATVPRAAQEVLNAKWHGWTPAEVDQQATACQPAGRTAPVALTADFDSDTKPDLALAVKTADGTKLVALLQRGEEYELFELAPPADGQAAYLGLEKRGTKYASPLTSTDDFYAADTLTAYRCGTPPVHYLWTGLGFKRVEAGKTP